MWQEGFKSKRFTLDETKTLVSWHHWITYCKGYAGDSNVQNFCQVFEQPCKKLNANLSSYSTMGLMEQLSAIGQGTRPVADYLVMICDIADELALGKRVPIP